MFFFFVVYCKLYIFVYVGVIEVRRILYVFTYTGVLCVRCNVVWFCVCNCYIYVWCVNMCLGFEYMLFVFVGRNVICL